MHGYFYNWLQLMCMLYYIYCTYYFQFSEYCNLKLLLERIGNHVHVCMTTENLPITVAIISPNVKYDHSFTLCTVSGPMCTNIHKALLFIGHYCSQGYYYSLNW